MSKLDPGAAAPSFDLPTDGAGRLSLAMLKGKAVVLYFYPKDDTSGCTQEAIEFNGLRKDFEKAGAVVLGVSPDPVKMHDKFKAKHGLEFGLLSDETKAMLEAYGVWVEKSMYGKKYMGTERTTFVIRPDGTIKSIFRKVSPAEHADTLLNDLAHFEP